MTEAPIRTFIALKLPEQLTSLLESTQQKLMEYGFKVRWVRPENIHLTVKFLGDIQISDVDRISAVISESVRNFQPFSFYTKGLGVFPGIRRPRVIWVGLGGEVDQISGFQHHLDQSLSAIGYPKEKRPFQGHLTLGRFKGSVHSGKLAEVLNSQSGFVSDTVTIDRVTLFKSDLKPSGAVYSELASIPLT